MNRALIFVCVCFLHSQLQAETLVAVADPWSPYITPELVDQGVAARTIRAALQQQGFDVEIHFMPWARALLLVQNGSADLLVAAWWTQERSSYLHFSEPYTENSLKLIKRKDDLFQFNGLKSLAGKRIGVVRGYGYADKFLLEGHFQRVENSDFLANMRMLMVGRIDLTLEDERVAISILTQEAPELLEQIEFISPPLLTQKLYAATGLNHPDHQRIITAIDQGLAALRADGSLELLLQIAD